MTKPTRATTTRTETIEIRIKIQGDTRPWENIPPFVKTLETPLNWEKAQQMIDMVLGNLADAFDNTDEIRWNYADSLQGHYVRPSKQ